MASRALSHLRICDFTGQLAGAGATRFLAAFGAQVIRIEAQDLVALDDRVRQELLAQIPEQGAGRLLALGVELDLEDLPLPNRADRRVAERRARALDRRALRVEHLGFQHHLDPRLHASTPPSPSARSKI